MTYFITGANGLAGSHIVKKLLEEGKKIKILYRQNANLSLLEPYTKDYANQIEWIEGNVLDVPRLREVLHESDRVIHAAALVSFHRRDENKIIKTNVEGTANMINVALEKNVKWFCHISSIAALGGSGQLIDENAKWSSENGTSGYGFSKYCAEVEVYRGIAEGLQAVIVNPSVIIGRGEWHKSTGQLFQYVAKENRYYSQGNINVVDADDLADVIFRLADLQIAGERFVVNADCLPFKDFFELIAAALQKKAPSKLASPFQLNALRIAESWLSIFTNKPPRLSKETIKAALQTVRYDNTKIKKLLNINFLDAETSIKKVAVQYL